MAPFVERLKSDLDGDDDVAGSRKALLARSTAKKLQAKLIVDAERLIKKKFINLPAAVNLSFVLENVAGAVKDRHVKKNKNALEKPIPKAALFDWLWNKPEVPSLVTLGSWWICSLLSQARAPIGEEVGPLSISALGILHQAEEISLRGVSKLFSTLLSHHSENMKHHGGAAAERASHVVWSSMFPDALARATRDACSLTWPHLRPFLDTADSCVALVGMWSYLVTGDKGPHIFAKNIAKSKVKTWGKPTDLAPAQVHLRRAEADRPSTFPALDRRRLREREIRERIVAIQDHAKVMALPFHEREIIEKIKKCAVSTCPLGIPLKEKKKKMSNPPQISGRMGEQDDTKMKHGRFVLGRSPLVQLALSPSDLLNLKEFGRDVASVLSESNDEDNIDNISELSYDMVEVKPPPTISPTTTRRKKSNQDSSRNPTPAAQPQLPRQDTIQECSSSLLKAPDEVKLKNASAPPPPLLEMSVMSPLTMIEKEAKKRDTPKRGDSTVSLTFAPATYEIEMLLQRFSKRPNSTGGVDSQQECVPSLYASLLGKSAVKSLGEPINVTTPILTHRWAPEAISQLKPLRQLSQQRIVIKQNEEHEDRIAIREAKLEGISLQNKRFEVLESKLDVSDHARRTLDHALAASKAPVSMVQVRRVRDYHSERGTLPRHHAVRLESFSKK